jgi:8-oxo-dGTP pyrophosphatase MutT (NUDIX family)
VCLWLSLTNNRFPNQDTDPAAYAQYIASLWTVLWQDELGSFPIGYMPEPIYQELLQVPEQIRGEVSSDTKDLTLHLRALEQLGSESDRTAKAARLSQYWRDNQTFPIVSKGWRNELWPIYGRDSKTPLFSFERAAVGLLGAMRYGVHMTAYVRGTPVRGSKYDYRIWVAKRAATKSSHPGMLDNTAAGGASTADGLDMFECMIREANEEASFTDEVMRSRAKGVGTISYINITDEQAGMPDLIYPEVQWVFDLELPQDGSVVPRPKDGEAEGFILCSIEEVQEQLSHGLYKPNCAIISEWRFGQSRHPQHSC